MLGEPAVGKTSLIRRYVQDIFNETYLATLGATVSKRLEAVALALEHTQADITLVIWDMMGNQRIMDLIGEAYLTGALGALAVFDVTRPETLEALGFWVETAKGIAGNIPIIGLGNKSDVGERAVTERDASCACEELGLSYLATSAKTGLNVEAAFNLLATEVTKAAPKRSQWASPTAQPPS